MLTSWQKKRTPEQREFDDKGEALDGDKGKPGDKEEAAGYLGTVIQVVSSYVAAEVDQVTPPTGLGAFEGEVRGGDLHRDCDILFDCVVQDNLHCEWIQKYSK